MSRKYTELLQRYYRIYVSEIRAGRLATHLCMILVLTACKPDASERAEHLDLSPDQSQGKMPRDSNTKIASAPNTSSRKTAQTATTASQMSTKPQTKEASEVVEAIGFAGTEPTGRVPAHLSGSSNRTTCNTFYNNNYHHSAEAASALSESRTNYCQKISNRLASVTMRACLAASLVPSGCESVEGVPLMIREFAPLPNKSALGKVLVIGGTHGDELTSVSVTFRWIEKLNQYHSGLFHWHIIPAMNPDGLLKRGATRTNQNGVDLNRNMPSDDWRQNALKYWEHKGSKDPRKFPGERANSEPESQWLVDEIEKFKPDAIIAVHAPYGVVDFDAQQLNTAPRSLGKLHLNLLGTYPGSLGNYAGINLNIPVITLELPHSWEMPSVQESDLIWRDIVRWLKKNVNANTAAAAD